MFEEEQGIHLGLLTFIITKLGLLLQRQKITFTGQNQKQERIRES